jgi:prepilin-type N-terminal cleavage/methylation domain-containing protein
MARSSSRTRRTGFTLLEVVVALSVGSLIVLATHELFRVVVDSAERVPAAARSTNRVRNGERLLQELFARVEIGIDSASRFAGFPHDVRFDSWCSAAGGWLERCTVALALVTHGDSVSLDGVWGQQRTRFATASGSGRFRYLRSAELGGAWLERWGDAISAPLAVEVHLGGRTIFLRIGGRG